MVEETAKSIPTEKTRGTFFENLYARCYDSIYHLMPYRKLLWDAYQALDLKPGMKVLDAGCGTGNFELFISEKNPPPIEIEAIDFSPTIISQAESRCNNLPYVRFKQVDLSRKLDYPDNFFDRVVCTNAPCFLGNERKPRFTFEELLRVLKSGGKIILITPASNSEVLSILTRNHLRRIKYVQKLHRKMLALLSAFPAIISLRSIYHQLKKVESSRSNTYGELNILPARRLLSVLDQNGLEATSISLTNAGQAWIATGNKPPSKLTTFADDVKASGSVKKTGRKKEELVRNRQVVVREATADDVSGIRAVEVDAWGEEKAATVNQIRSRIEFFPEGNLIAEVNGKIVGYISFMLIDYTPFSLNGTNTWYQITDDGYTTTHDFGGKDLLGINLSVAKKAPRRTSMSLIVEVIRRGIEMGVRSYILGSRIPSYYKYSSQMTVEEYVRAKTSSGKPIDPELRFYVDVGMKITDVVPNYYKDPQSLDYGVIMKKDNPFHKNLLLSFLARSIAHIPYDFAKLVEKVRY